MYCVGVSGAPLHNSGGRVHDRAACGCAALPRGPSVEDLCMAARTLLGPPGNQNAPTRSTQASDEEHAILHRDGEDSGACVHDRSVEFPERSAGAQHEDDACSVGYLLTRRGLLVGESGEVAKEALHTVAEVHTSDGLMHFECLGPFSELTEVRIKLSHTQYPIGKLYSCEKGRPRQHPLRGAARVLPMHAALLHWISSSQENSLYSWSVEHVWHVICVPR